MIYYPLTKFCVFGSLMRAYLRWVIASKMYSNAFIHHCNPSGKTYLDKAPVFPFSSCFTLLDMNILIRKLWFLNPLVSPGCSLALNLSGVSFSCVLHVNQGHQWDQYQDWPALPVRMQCSRKFANSHSAIRQTRHSPHTKYGDERSRRISGFADHHSHTKTTHKLFIICLHGLCDQSILSSTSQHPFRLCKFNSV